MFYYYCSFFLKKCNKKNKILDLISFIFFVRNEVKIRPRYHLPYAVYFSLKNKYKYLYEYVLYYFIYIMRQLKRRKRKKNKIKFFYLCKKRKNLSRKLRYVKYYKKRKFKYV